MIEEVWNPIPGTKGYEASTEGRIRRPDGFVLAPQVHNEGYRHVKVRMADTGKRRTVTVHRLVAAAFLGVRPEGMEVAHGDHDKTNNRLSNLRYATHEENMNDGHRKRIDFRLPWDMIAVGESFISKSWWKNVAEAASSAERQFQKAFRVQHLPGKPQRTLVTRTPMLGAMTCSATTEIGGAA